MSETALTLMKRSLRLIGVLASGETPNSDMSAEALEAMKHMFQNWSATGIRLWFVTSENFTFSASPSTIGTGGTLNTARPEKVLSAYMRDSGGHDSQLTIIDYLKYSRISNKSLTGTAAYLYYSPEYPLGKIYIEPIGTGTLYLDSLKPLTDPTAITSTVAFPPEYNDAIAFNLAVRLAPEYGREPSQVVRDMAAGTLRIIENKNFAERVVMASPEVIKIARTYDINEG